MSIKELILTIIICSGIFLFYRFFIRKIEQEEEDNMPRWKNVFWEEAIAFFPIAEIAYQEYSMSLGLIICYLFFGLFVLRFFAYANISDNWRRRSPALEAEIYELQQENEKLKLQVDYLKRELEG